MILDSGNLAFYARFRAALLPQDDIIPCVEVLGVRVCISINDVPGSELSREDRVRNGTLIITAEEWREIASQKPSWLKFKLELIGERIVIHEVRLPNKRWYRVL